ncbi:cupin domain-containing protein [Asaia lannensis]|uniref:Cupin domain-containing protein n=1 Tax=Asaia lannensis NBRC 102526 TaxID=1307926 RepID=A0ABT1CD15_9PROT|nr:cupin domain-containing protein [Asaia lannensis]MCO6158753.1 cupin domain-containing protein [Asaia lannensis NBRC 102526]GBR00306.1 cupin [Asaia lannensis NBRC 102526]
MKITRAGSFASAQGRQEWFTGKVRIDAPFAGSGVLACATVTFEPGARTAWHSHPLGQTILIQSGLGWVQREGEAIEQVRPGDLVFFEPGERHWHGASSACAMSHIAITESLEGVSTTWMEHVSDADYRLTGDTGPQ